MELDLTPDETSLLVGILVIWRQIIPHEKYEEMLILSIIDKIFTEDKIAVDMILHPEKNAPTRGENQ